MSGEKKVAYLGEERWSEGGSGRRNDCGSVLAVQKWQI